MFKHRKFSNKMCQTFSLCQQFEVELNAWLNYHPSNIMKDVDEGFHKNIWQCVANQSRLFM